MPSLKQYLFLSLFIASPLINASVNDTFNRIKSDPNALYAFFKEMPKGGELHYHLAGGAYPETMLKIAATGNYCLNPDTFAMTPVATSCEGTKGKDLSATPALYEKVLRAWSMKNFIAGTESGHEHFFATFYKFMSVVEDNHIPLLAEVMRRAANQHEQYLEIMVMPDKAKSANLVNLAVIPENYDKFRQLLLANGDFNAETQKTITTANSLVPDAQKYLGCDQSPQQDVCKLHVKFQYHVLRGQPLEKIFPQALHAFEAASGSEAIVGVNIVQEEDSFIVLRDYHQQMEIFNYLHKHYPQVHISLHAGELAKGDVLPENLRFHITDAIYTGHAERIGHGVDIAFENKSGELLHYMANQPVPVEINLISNEKILNVTGAEHPLRYYLAHHVPVVLSTDDEGVLRTDLTSQYVTAVVQHGLDYPTIKQINRNALSYSFVPGKSLWKNNEKAIPVPECKELNSETCTSFVGKNEKAALQRQLELKLLQFERDLENS